MPEGVDPRPATTDEFWEALVAASNDRPALLRLIADRVVGELGDGCVLTLVSADGETLVPEVICHQDPVVSEAMEAVLRGEHVRLGEGLAGSAAADRRSLMVNALPPSTVSKTTPARFLPFVRDHPMRAVLVAPLIAGGELLGTLGAFRTSSDEPYTAADLRLLESLSHQVALALSAALAGPRSIGTADYEAIYRHNLDGVVLSTPDGHHLAANPAACRILRRTEREIVDGGRAEMLVSDDPRLARALAERAATGQARAELTMRRGDGSTFDADVSSTIYISPQGKARTVIIFRDISAEVAARREAIAKLDELSEAADRDPLTGLWNRRGFAVAATHALAEADRNDLPSQIVFLDLDGLKSVNDTHGHAAGDAVIITVAEAIDHALREVDVACRLGGDEFVFLAVDAPEEAVSGLVRRIADELERADLPVRPGFTIGVIERQPHDPLTLAELIDAADRNMYQRKVLRRLGEQQP